jgi:hypothetical protein
VDDHHTLVRDDIFSCDISTPTLHYDTALVLNTILELANWRHFYCVLIPDGHEIRATAKFCEIYGSAAALLVIDHSGATWDTLPQFDCHSFTESPTGQLI